MVRKTIHFAYLDIFNHDPGEIVYCRLFSQDIVILNSEKVARDLIERRSQNYSTRPPGHVRVLDL